MKVVGCFALVATAIVAVSATPDDGIWTFRGYGLTINKQGDQASLFEETEISCIQDKSFTELGQVISAYEYVSRDSNDTIRAAVGALGLVVLDRTDEHLAGCAEGITPVQGDDDYERNALEIFDILDAGFEEHYAFFQQKNVDWTDATAQVRNTLTEDSTDEELSAAIVPLINPLGGIIQKEVGPDNPFITAKARKIEIRLREQFEKGGNDEYGFETFEEFADAMFTNWTNTISGFMEGGLKGNIIPYGKFEDHNFGYIRMQDFSVVDVSGLESELNAIFEDLKGTDALIVDMRVTSGLRGSDRVPLLLTSYFTATPRQAFVKAAYDRNSNSSFTEVTEFITEPMPGSGVYKGNVLLMISDSTVGSAEIFSLAMLQIPDTQYFGLPTSGDLSFKLVRTLPNGWQFGFSNEVYAAPAGQEFEGIGIQPTIYTDAPLLPLSELKAGNDTWLENAVQEIVKLKAKADADAAAAAAAADESPDSGAIALGASFLVSVTITLGLMLLH